MHTRIAAPANAHLTTFVPSKPSCCFSCMIVLATMMLDSKAFCQSIKTPRSTEGCMGSFKWGPPAAWGRPSKAKVKSPIDA
jgi:hypothetical protein